VPHASDALLRPPRPGVTHLAQRRLLSFLEAHPGRSLRELADHLGVTRTAAVYHVRRLERRGLVTRLRHGTRRLLFPSSIPDTAGRHLLASFRLHNARVIAQALHADPTLSWRAVARKLGLGTNTVRWHVARLEEQGLIRVVARGRRRHVIALHPELQQALVAADHKATTS
jgi:predicted transcriptional regulator